MVKIKGGTAGSVEALKSDLDKKSGGNLWIKSIPGGGEGIEVRFLTEPDEWFAYREHWEDGSGYFPCIGDGCPGCESDNKKVSRTSRRWLANAVDVDSGFVIPLKLPLEAVNRLIQRFERHNSTIMDRNYLLLRYGTGLDTSYDVESQAPSEFPVDNYEEIDLYEVLAESFAESFGEDSIETDPSDAPELDLSKAKQKKKEREEALLRQAEQAHEEEDEDDGEEEYLTEADLLRMNKEELMVIADNLEVEVTMTMKKQEMVDAIIENA